MSIDYSNIQKFTRDVVEPAIEPPDLLESAVGWIAENLDPEDVFSDAALRLWAKDNGLVEDEE
jgi:hypothetical protein